LPRNAPKEAGSADATARLAMADLLLSVGADGTIIGRAIYETVPGSGRLLAVEIPAGGSILWAAVDSNPVVPLRSASGYWSILLDGRGQGRVVLIWKAPPKRSGGPDSGAGSIALPRAGAGATRALVTVWAPPGMAIGPVTGGLEHATLARLELIRAQFLGQAIRDVLATLDRSSGRDHERLASLVISHELALRGAARSAHWTAAGMAPTPSDDAERVLQSIPTARKALASAVESAGAKEDLAAAASYLGDAPAPPGLPPVAIPEPNGVCRIRAFGRPIAIQGNLAGIEEPAARSTLNYQDQSEGSIPVARLLAGRAGAIASLLVAASIAMLFLGGYRVARAAAIAIGLGIAGYAGGPALLVAALALTAMSWTSGHAPN
jgi:hypothetical protein